MICVIYVSFWLCICSKYSNISVIHQCMFNIAKQRTNWWDQIIPILYDPPLPPQLTSSQQISLRFSQRSILLYLLKMPALKQFRSPIAATLKKLDTKSDAIDSAIRYADVCCCFTVVVIVVNDFVVVVLCKRINKHISIIIFVFYVLLTMVLAIILESCGCISKSF